MHLSSVRRGRGRDRQTDGQQRQGSEPTVLPPPTSIALRHPTAETYAAVRARVTLARPAAYPTTFLPPIPAVVEEGARSGGEPRGPRRGAARRVGWTSTGVMGMGGKWCSFSGLEAAAAAPAPQVLRVFLAWHGGGSAQIRGGFCGRTWSACHWLATCAQDGTVNAESSRGGILCDCVAVLCPVPAAWGS
jgi:hypothetical protein